ncbi:hypothetical protein M0E84_09665 [Corynebacterium sp. CCM 9186]|uniref:hypothetical protein n=1 Tax=Corynebacterium meridianum TaxID=2765363 RepID=UPI0020069733|nr:hypothetical protein [Corynebacterium meridianum]MCK7678293.1 hypothetical protein [Corynebacterium meridianum]
MTTSLHVAGMYALAPLLGFTADRFGRLPTVVAGYAMIAGCCVLLIIGDGETVMVVIALTLLGLVGSSALLVDVVPAGMRVRAQGRSDPTMNVARPSSVGPCPDRWRRCPGCRCWRRRCS